MNFRLLFYFFRGRRGGEGIFSGEEMRGERICVCLFVCGLTVVGRYFS